MSGAQHRARSAAPPGTGALPTPVSRVRTGRAGPHQRKLGICSTQEEEREHRSVDGTGSMDHTVEWLATWRGAMWMSRRSAPGVPCRRAIDSQKKAHIKRESQGVTASADSRTGARVAGQPCPLNRRAQPPLTFFRSAILNDASRLSVRLEHACQSQHPIESGSSSTRLPPRRGRGLGGRASCAESRRGVVTGACPSVTRAWLAS